MTSPQLQTPSNTAFEFVKTLADELSTGKVDLPSFPEIAHRVRRVLSEPKASLDQVVRVVGSEPALAARLMRISNSASLNRSGRAIVDLRTAVNRIGYNMVRSAAMAFSMAQLRKANKLAGLEHHLNDLWSRSTLVAASAYVLARTCSKVSPDEAMLCGTMHGIGKLYVLTRAAGHAEFFTDKVVLAGIVTDWHASIGKAILENWEFPDEMARAVGDQDDHTRDDPGAAPDLRDVLAVAILMASYSTDDVTALELALQNLPTAQRLGLNKTKTSAVLRESAAEVSELHQALSR